MNSTDQRTDLTWNHLNNIGPKNKLFQLLPNAYLITEEKAYTAQKTAEYGPVFYRIGTDYFHI